MTYFCERPCKNVCNVYRFYFYVKKFSYEFDVVVVVLQHMFENV